jgi:hypothetical protein
MAPGRTEPETVERCVWCGQWLPRRRIEDGCPFLAIWYGRLCNGSGDDVEAGDNGGADNRRRSQTSAAEQVQNKWRGEEGCADC